MRSQAELVVDASVALKWVLPAEEHADRAQALLEHQVSARRYILVPPHFRSEVTNAIFQRARRKEQGITVVEAEEALGFLLLLPIELALPADLYVRAFACARARGLKDTYDSLYVVLAEMAGAELWTDDRVLLKAIGPSAPWVRWIGDYAPAPT